MKLSRREIEEILERERKESTRRRLRDVKRTLTEVRRLLSAIRALIQERPHASLDSRDARLVDDLRFAARKIESLLLSLEDEIKSRQVIAIDLLVAELRRGWANLERLTKTHHWRGRDLSDAVRGAFGDITAVLWSLQDSVPSNIGFEFATSIWRKQYMDEALPEIACGVVCTIRYEAALDGMLVVLASQAKVYSYPSDFFAEPPEVGRHVTISLKDGAADVRYEADESITGR